MAKPHKQKLIAELSVELPRLDMGPVLVSLAHDGLCEETGESAASLSFDLGEGSMCSIYELTPDALMRLAFVLTMFANSMEGKEI